MNQQKIIFAVLMVLNLATLVKFRQEPSTSSLPSHSVIQSDDAASQRQSVDDHAATSEGISNLDEGLASEVIAPDRDLSLPASFSKLGAVFVHATDDSWKITDSCASKLMLTVSEQERVQTIVSNALDSIKNDELDRMEYRKDSNGDEYIFIPKSSKELVFEEEMRSELVTVLGSGRGLLLFEALTTQNFQDFHIDREISFLIDDSTNLPAFFTIKRYLNGEFQGITTLNGDDPTIALRFGEVLNKSRTLAQDLKH